MKKFRVSIGIQGIVANYEAVVEAENEAEAEQKLRDAWEDCTSHPEIKDAAITDEDYQGAELMDEIGVHVEEIEEND